MILPPPPLPLHRWVSRCGGSFVYGRAFGILGHKFRGGRSWHLRCRVWGISPPRRRASFWVPRKEPKRHRGEPQVELRPFGLVLHAVSPLDPPFYGGRQLGSSCGFPKGAGGMGNDFSSLTAAADWVVFPLWWFLRLKARLCVRWDTSCAVVEGVVAFTTLERWLRRRRRGRGIPPSSAVHRIRAQWPGGSWDCPLKAPRAGMFLSMNRRIPP